MTRPTFEPGPANRAFLMFVCAIVWLIVVPVFAIARFCKALRTRDHDGGDDAHECCAIDPLFPHNETSL